MFREATATGRVLIVDETRRTGGVGEGVLAALVDHGYTGRLARVTSHDSFVPLGEAALHVLLSEETVEAAADEDRPRLVFRETAHRSRFVSDFAICPQSRGCRRGA